MSALTDALVAAQARAIASLERAYVAGVIEDDKLFDDLTAIGCDDPIERDYLRQCLDTLRAYGTPATTAQNGGRKRATQNQLDYLRDLVSKGNPDAPTEWIGYLSKDDASKAIEQIKTGSFDINDWQVPF